MQLELFETEEKVEVKEGEETKVCKICSKEKPITAFYYAHKLLGRIDNRCKSCHNKQMQWKRETKVKFLHKCSGYCDICGVKEDSLHFDHDHTTLKFRGWLCRECNTGLGKLGDTVESLERALKYLKK